MKRICVFCGANKGSAPQYARAAERLGALIAGRGLGLVFGGGKVGLMGVVADAALSKGGEVIGVIPATLRERELDHRGCSEMRVVETMFDRKQIMADLADGFIVLPGGLGTLDELFEMLTWAQLGLHGKPCGLLNQDGFYDPLLAWLERGTREGFIKPQHLEMLLVENDPAALLERVVGWGGTVGAP